jgi:hypothetical protein
MMAQPYSSPDDPRELLKNRILLRMQEDQIDEQMMGLVKDAFAEALRAENIVLSRAENERIFRAVLREIPDDALNDLLKS